MNRIGEKVAILSNSPIFIGGLFKSGTTLLRAMLGQHSAIASGLETYWFDIDWNRVHDEKFKDRIQLLRDFYDIDKRTSDRIVKESKTIVDFLNNFLGYYARSVGKRRWLEKTPGNILHLDRIYAGWPEAKVIHIIRDPKDVYASLRQAKKWDTVEVFGELWCRFLGSAEDFKQRLNLDKDEFLEVRYEHLALNTRGTMKTILEFLGEKWEEGVAHFYGKQDDYYKVLELTGKASTTLDRLSKPISSERVGMWREDLREDEVREVRKCVEERGLLPLMEKLESESPK